MSKFVITGLPRSRTAWFAAYLTHGDVMCYHEGIYHGYKLEGYPIIGTADCGYAACPDWVSSVGEHKLVIIHRDPKEVALSLEKIGYPDNVGFLVNMVDALNKLKGLHIGFSDIDERLEDIHEYLGIPYDSLRADLFMNMNIQALEWSR